MYVVIAKDASNAWTAFGSWDKRDKAVDFADRVNAHLDESLGLARVMRVQPPRVRVAVRFAKGL